MECLVYNCKRKVIGRLSPDLDIKGLCYCLKHKTIVTGAYFNLINGDSSMCDELSKKPMKTKTKTKPKKGVKKINGSIRTQFKKGHKKLGGIMKGDKMSEESKLKMSIAKLGKPSHRKGKRFPQGTGENNNSYKGENAGYVAKHSWVTYWKGKPQRCEMCGTTKAKRFEWANIDHQYHRVLEDYISMCASCHRNYDKKFKKTK